MVNVYKCYESLFKEEEPQEESTHPYPDYPVSQAAPEGHHKRTNKVTTGRLFSKTWLMYFVEYSLDFNLHVWNIHYISIYMFDYLG